MFSKNFTMEFYQKRCRITNKFGSRFFEKYVDLDSIVNNNKITNTAFSDTIDWPLTIKKSIRK